MPPHLEFRFPLYGSISHNSLVLEVRQALEPWHVMGEEGAPGGTVRYVDSSVEAIASEAFRLDRFPVCGSLQMENECH